MDEGALRRPGVHDRGTARGIEAPARRKAVFFEQEEQPAGSMASARSLVTVVLDDVAAMPGALPLLSFALAELYRQAMRRRIATRSADRALRMEDYHAIGGVIGALQKRATELYDAEDVTFPGPAGDALRESIRMVLLRMVSQEGARLTRRRIELAELVYADRQRTSAFRPSSRNTWLRGCSSSTTHSSNQPTTALSSPGRR